MARYRTRYFHGNDPDDEFGEWGEFENDYEPEDFADRITARQADPLSRRRLHGIGRKIVDEDGKEVYTYYPEDDDEGDSNAFWWVLAVIAVVIVLLVLAGGN